MPTYYTSKLMEKGQTFSEFVMLCARAMGICIDMRESSLEEPIPEKFEVNTHDLKRLKSAKKELKILENMNTEKKLIYGKNLKKKAIKSYEKYIKQEADENKRLTDMENSVNLWESPPELKGLKDFMLQQIDISKHDSYYSNKEVRKRMSQSDISYHKNTVEQKKWNVDYHTKEHEKEVTRVTKRNELFKQLRESLSKCQL